MVKDFDQEQRDRHSLVTLEDRQFKFGGKTFTRRTSFSPRVLLKMDEAERDGDIRGTYEAIADALIPECRDDFLQTTLESEDISMETVRSLAIWLVEQAASRPTTPSVPSTNGHVTEPTGTPLMGGSFSTVTPPAQPASTSEGSVTPSTPPSPST